jgi:hypothetical protein
MTARRLASSAVLFAAVSGGCAASRVGHNLRPDVVAERPQIDAPAIADVVARNNQNAQQITSLKAEPTVSGKFGMRSAGTRGQMAFERPHNFRFVVSSGMGKREADVGSNDDEFWFWANNDKDKNVYVCRYDAPSNVIDGKELAFQPDWFVEALGLREIPEEEARQIKVTAGPRPNTYTWTHRRVTSGGVAVKKISIVDRSGQIVEHQFFLPGMKGPIATASSAGTKDVALADDPNRTVRVPQKIHLRLSPEDPRATPIEMDLTLNNLTVNAQMDDKKRTALFTVPNYEGSEISRVGGQADPATRRSATNRPRGEIRQSSPAPEAGSGAEVGQPSPIGVDGAYLLKKDPMPLSADLGRRGDEIEPAKLVGMPGPQAPETPADRITRSESAPYQQ